VSGAVADDDPRGYGLGLPSAGRTAILAPLGLFWLWLLARWLNDWTAAGGLVVPPDQPFVPSATFGGTDTALGFAVQFLPQLASAAWLTIVLTVAGIAFGFVLAVPLSVLRVYGGRARVLSLSVTELIRGTPLLAQLFVLYYGLPLSGWIRELPAVGQGIVPAQAVWVAIIGFTINSAAYQSEYIRSAIESVDPGQLTAARAVGLSQTAGIRYVVMPQALRYAIPGWTNELVYLIKYSSLAGFITVPELYYRANRIASSNFRYTAVFTLVALMYLGLVLSATQLMDRVEDRVAIPGLGQAGRES